MVPDELTRALIDETTLDDISESYRPVVEIIGIEKFIELSEYAKGTGVSRRSGTDTIPRSLQRSII